MGLKSTDPLTQEFFSTVNATALHDLLLAEFTNAKPQIQRNLGHGRKNHIYGGSTITWLPRRHQW